MIILDLTPLEVKALRELAQEYLDKGPAWECMQLEWDEPHAACDLETLRDKIVAATE